MNFVKGAGKTEEKQYITDFVFNGFSDYNDGDESGKLASLETAGEYNVPVNVYAEDKTDFTLLPGEACTAEVIGIGSGIQAYESEEAYLDSWEHAAPVSLIPIGTFSHDGKSDFEQSPDILFTGKVVETEIDPDAEPHEPNFRIVVETLDMTLTVYARYNGKIEPGYTVQGHAWLFGDVTRKGADNS